MPEPQRGEFRGGPSKPSSVVLRGAAKREDGPATTGLGKTAQEPRAATEGCPYTRPVRQVPGRHKDHPSDAGWYRDRHLQMCPTGLLIMCTKKGPPPDYQAKGPYLHFFPCAWHLEDIYNPRTFLYREIVAIRSFLLIPATWPSSLLTG